MSSNPKIPPSHSQRPSSLHVQVQGANTTPANLINAKQLKGALSAKGSGLKDLVKGSYDTFAEKHGGNTHANRKAFEQTLGQEVQHPGDTQLTHNEKQKLQNVLDELFPDVKP